MWKVLKLVAVIMTLAGIVWFAGGQHGFVLGGLLFFVEFLSLQLPRLLIRSDKPNLY